MTTGRLGTGGAGGAAQTTLQWGRWCDHRKTTPARKAPSAANRLQWGRWCDHRKTLLTPYRICFSAVLQWGRWCDHRKTRDDRLFTADRWIASMGPVV